MWYVGFPRECEGGERTLLDGWRENGLWMVDECGK